MARDSTKQKRGDPTKAPLSVPSKFVGTDWAERIRIAREAREIGREMRKGKPKSFYRFPNPKIKYPTRPRYPGGPMS